MEGGRRSILMTFYINSFDLVILKYIYAYVFLKETTTIYEIFLSRNQRPPNNDGIQL